MLGCRTCLGAETGLYLYCAAKVAPLVVVGCSIKARLQPIPAGLPPVQARLALFYKESQLRLHSMVTFHMRLHFK